MLAAAIDSDVLAQVPSSEAHRELPGIPSPPASGPDLLAAEFLRLNEFEASVAHFQEHVRAVAVENLSDPRPATVKALEQREVRRRVIDAELPALRRDAARVVRETWTEQEMEDINAFLNTSSGRSFLAKSHRFQEKLTPVFTAWAVETQGKIIVEAMRPRP